MLKPIEVVPTITLSEKYAPYKHVYSGGRKSQMDKLCVKEHTFMFKNRFSNRYRVDVHHYPHNLFFIKFFKFQHKLSPLKYNILTGEKDAFRILSTCLSIAQSIGEKYWEDLSKRLPTTL